MSPRYDNRLCKYITIIDITNISQSTTYYIHYISANFILRSHLLEAEEFSDSHTVESLETFSGYLVAATTVNCSNMVCALFMNN